MRLVESGGKLATEHAMEGNLKVEFVLEMMFVPVIAKGGDVQVCIKML